MDTSTTPQKPTAKTPIQQLNEITPLPGSYDPKDVRAIIGLLETVSTAPTDFPKTFWDSIKIYESGGTKRLYVYSQGSKTWRYVALT